MGIAFVARRWKLVFNGTVIGELADLFQIAWYNECLQKGKKVSKSRFMLDIIWMGLGEYIRMIEMNNQIRIAWANNGKKHPSQCGGGGDGNQLH